MLRFTKDELLAMRKPNSKILDSMADMSPEIVSEVALDPVCWEPFDQDEVIRLWQASIQQARRPNAPEGLGPKKNRQKGESDIQVICALSSCRRDRNLFLLANNHPLTPNPFTLTHVNCP